MYKISLTTESEIDLAKLKKSEPMSFKKAIKLIDELMEHPYTGTGKPEQLKGNRTGQWSRRITDKHRLIYKVDDEVVEVLVLSAWGHYQK